MSLDSTSSGIGKKCSNASAHLIAASNDTPLHYAASLGDLELAQALLKRHAEVNATGRNGHTPLHLAVHGRTCKPSIVKLLLEHGADVNARGSWGHTPLHYAYADVQIEICSMLIGAGAQELGATWLKEHHYDYGHYDISSLNNTLANCYPDQRRHQVTPAELYDEVCEDKNNPRRTCNN